MTHDYKRNGTVDLFAALNVATGEVIHACRKKHTAADVLAFFKLIDANVPRGLDIHVVLDNLSAHKGPEVADWLAHPRRKRWHLHFTPTSRVGSIDLDPPLPEAVGQGRWHWRMVEGLHLVGFWWENADDARLRPQTDATDRSGG